LSDIQMLNIADHKDTRVIRERSAAYGDDVMYVMTFPLEFRSVQAFYPILLQRDPRGELYPVALFGFQERENLFLDETGWHARYVPAMIRRQPFLIAFEGGSGGDGTERRRMLSIDMDHPRVSSERGEPLFDVLGGRTPYLEEMANLLETIYQGAEMNRKFVAALLEHQLVESVSFEITLADGSRNQLVGFSTIDEERVQGLSGKVLGELSSQGLLMPLFMMLASTTNVRTLIDLKNARLQD
jgi:hypothetical protein